MGYVGKGEGLELFPLSTWPSLRSCLLFQQHKMESTESELPQDLPVIDGAADDKNEESDINYERHHAKLLDAISSLDGVKRVRHTLRTVPGKGVSEFGFKSGGTERSQQLLSELVGSLGHSASHGSLKKQLKVAQKRSKVLPAPLPKYEKEKIQRTVGYDKAVGEVSKWTSAVLDNRRARQLIFPLHRPNKKLVNAHIKFKPVTSFEKEMAAVLNQRNPDDVIHKGKVFTPAEEKELAGMTLEEAKACRAELLKYRALIYNKESKLRWQNKIKSKRYRRALKKEKLKKEEKELEELQRTNPEEFLAKLEKLDKDRIKERTNLRHRGGSKFAKQQMMYSKFDDQKRQAVQDMIQKSKELTKKAQVEEDSDPEDATGNWDEAELSGGTSNPWMQVPTTKIPEFSRPQPVQNKAPDIIVSSEDEEEETDEIQALFVDKEKEGISEEKTDATKAKEHTLRASRKVDGQATSTWDPQNKVDKETDENYEVNLEDNSKKKNKGKKVKQTKKKDVASDRVREKPTDNGDNLMDAALLSENLDKKGKGDKKKLSANKKKDERSAAFVAEKALRKAEPDSLEHVRDDEDLIEMALDRRTTLEQLEQLEESAGVPTLPHEHPPTDSALVTAIVDDASAKKSHEEYVDPNVLLSLKSKPVGRQTADVAMEGEDNIDDAGDEGRMTIMEAFEEDDVVAEFLEAKKQTIEEEKPKDIDLTLPGWGEWGGPGLKPSMEKKTRFTIKAKEEKREDSHLGNVIISKKQNTAVLKHLVQKVPYPFKNAEEYAASLKTPIGREWNTENAFKTLTKPKVVTKLGAVIDPLDSSVLLKPAKRKAEVDIELNSQKGFKRNRNKATPKVNKKHKK